MLVLLIIQQLLDWISTTLALRHVRGAEEVNPVVSYMMRIMPASVGLLLVKMMGIIIIGMLAKKHPELVLGFKATPFEWVIFGFMFLAYSYAIYGNLRLYLRKKKRGA